jgi:hypothetical protein
MDGFALRSRQPSGPCRSQNRSSRRRASLSRHYCDPAPCLASSRDRPWNRHCKELDRCSFIRDATIGRTSTIRPRVGRQRHQWPAVKGWRRRWGTWICFQDEAGQILRPPKATTWARRGATPVVGMSGKGLRPGTDRRPGLSQAEPLEFLAGRYQILIQLTQRPGPAGNAWRRPARRPGCTGSAATPGSTGASRAAAPDMIERIDHVRPRVGQSLIRRPASRCG